MDYSSNTFNLITTVNNNIVRNRLNEVIFCVQRNTRNHLIKNIFIFVELPEKGTELNPNLAQLPKDYPEIKLVEINKRPTYKDFFTFCNKYESQKWILCNSDIYFPASNIHELNLLLEQDYDKECFVLTRYNVLLELSDEIIKRQDGFIVNIDGYRLRTQHKTGSSVDSWIFQTPLDISRMNLDIESGRPECDGRMNYELSKIRKVSNPCLSVISIHKHHNWSPAVYNKIDYNGEIFNRRQWNDLMEKRGYRLCCIPPCKLS